MGANTHAGLSKDEGVQQDIIRSGPDGAEKENYQAADFRKMLEVTGRFAFNSSPQFNFPATYQGTDRKTETRPDFLLGDARAFADL